MSLLSFPSVPSYPHPHPIYGRDSPIFREDFPTSLYLPGKLSLPYPDVYFGNLQAGVVSMEMSPHVLWLNTWFLANDPVSGGGAALDFTGSRDFTASPTWLPLADISVLPAMMDRVPQTGHTDPSSPIPFRHHKEESNYHAGLLYLITSKRSTVTLSLISPQPLKGTT